MRGFTWKNQSKFTDPGAAGAVIDELPADLAALREASSQLVFHYRADGDWAESGVPAERAGEIDTRYADAMLALQAARAGTSDPERHLTAPGLDAAELRGWPLLARHVVHDLAALNKTEMLVWDAWGMQLGIGPGPVAEQDAVLLDEICAHLADPGASPGVVAALAGRDELRVPAAVTSFDPCGGLPREVTLRP